VRAFRILTPSLNGATYQLDGGEAFPCVCGQLLEFQPRFGVRGAGRDNVGVRQARLLSRILATIKGEDDAPDVEDDDPPRAPGKLYPTVTFNNGLSSMPYQILIDVDDGNEYVPGALSLSDTTPIAQEWDQIPYGTSTPALNGTQLGILGTPILTKDESTGRLFIPFGANGFLAVITTMSPGDNQVFDQTAVGGAALSTGTISGSTYRHLICRIAGLTAPTSRTLTLNGVRDDGTSVPVWSSGAIGATITDYEL